MIYVTGSLAYDFIMDFPGKFSDQIVPEKIHQINISFLVDTLREGRGGTAGNIAYNLALLGQKTAIIASAGRDFSPYRKFLKKYQIDDSLVKIVKNDFTARAFITTDLKDNQITGFYPGANKNDIYLKLPDYLTPSDFVVISVTIPEAMSNHVNFCIANNIPFLFDPGMQLPRLNAKSLHKGVTGAKIVIANDYEMSLLEKKLNTKLSKIIKKEQIFITTLGENGSLIQTVKEKIMTPPAKPRKIVDPTGAGDAYRAGFLAGFLKKYDLAVCGKMGSLAAVYAIEKYGTSEHFYTKEEFEKRFKENYG